MSNRVTRRVAITQQVEAVVVEGDRTWVVMMTPGSVLFRVYSSVPRGEFTMDQLLELVKERIRHAADRDGALRMIDQPSVLFVPGWELWPGNPAPLFDYLKSVEFAAGMDELPIEHRT